MAEATDNKFQIQTFAGGRDRRRPAGAGCGAERRRRMRPYAGLFLYRQGADVRHSAPACRSASMPASSIPGGISPAARRSSTSVLGPLQLRSASHAASRARQMGGFFRKELKTVDDLQGPEVPHRRSRRPGAGEARRRAAADRRRRRLPGARARHHRRGRVRRPLRRREARLSKVAKYLLRARLVGGRRHAPPHRQPGEMERAAEELPGDLPCRPARRRTTGCWRSTMP